MKKNTATITIGIPAFNEGANIGYLLRELLKQKQDGFVIDKIIVISDGSTDNTVKAVREIENKKIKLVNHKDRQGAAKRQNEIIAMCQSDALILVDADILVGDSRFIKKISKPILANKADMTSCGYQAIKPNTFVGKALEMSLDFKNKIFDNYKDGGNIYTCRGTARAMSKKMYTNLRFNSSIGEDVYSYLYAKARGFQYQFVSNTIVSIRLPETIADHLKQSVRFVDSKKQLAKEFGRERIKQEFKLPIILMIKNSFYYLFFHPIRMTIYLLILFYSRVWGNKTINIREEWEISHSSKSLRKNQIKIKLNKASRSVIFLRRMIYYVIFILHNIIGKKYPRIVIFSYHSIADSNWRFSVSSEHFKKQINYLLKNFKPLTLGQAVRLIKDNKKIKDNFFVLSFDDGYKDILGVKDYLKEKGIKPALFVLSDEKKANRGELDNNLDFLNTKEIKALARDGWEIGCHSATHSNLAKLDGELLDKEIGQAKNKLRKRLGIKINYFSYPKGRYNKTVLESVRQSGYRAAVSMDDNIINDKSGLYVLPRVGVDGTHSYREFKTVFTILAILFRASVKGMIKVLSRFKKKGGAFDFRVIEKLRLFFVNRLVIRKKTKRQDLPRHVGGYKLNKIIYRPPGDDQYQFGIYINKTGKQGVVKQWDGKRKDGDYFWLINEIKTYQVFEAINKKYGKTIKRKFPSVKAPKLLEAIVEKNRLILFMEMLDGKTLDTVKSMPARMRAFEDVIRYFKYLGKLIYKSKLDKDLLKRGVLHSFFIFNYMFLRAGYLYPRKILSFIRAYIQFLASLPAMIRKNEYSFIHRDLTYMNVLVNQDKEFGVIDFELAVLAQPIYEITQIITGSWRRKDFWQEFYKLEIMKEIFQNKTKSRIYKGLTMFTAIHRIATSPKKDFNLHYSYLVHGFKIRTDSAGFNLNSLLCLPGANVKPDKTTN